MLDAMNECVDQRDLLVQLKKLTQHFNEANGQTRALRIMLSGRNDVQVKSFSELCVTVDISHAVTEADESYYIDTEMDEWKKDKPQRAVLHL
jgi:hypothetical protein